jgi:hypothetical protein
VRIDAATALRIGLVLFVVVWIFGPAELRSTVPVWLPFLLALGLELQFFLGAGRPGRAAPEARNRLPQAVDRERYGYPDEPDELLLVRDGADELWIPYAGESAEEVDELVAEARTQADREASVRAAPVPGDRRGLPVRRLVTGVGVIVALLAVVWIAESRRGWNGVGADARVRTEARLSAEAARIAGHPVTVRCDDAGAFVGAVQHSDGLAEVGGELAFLAPERCFHLYRLVFDGDVSFSQTARSVAVLAHEAWHLRGVRDEGTTECYALQSGVQLGRRLGLSESTARRMMRQQLVENQLRRGRTLEYRVPEECRGGGRLDLRPDVSSFP